MIGRSFRRKEGNLPRIIGHRGIASRAPENTMASLRAALSLGVPMIEVDVHLTADDEVVVIHDRTLQRTTTGNGSVRSYTRRELEAFDAGSWFDPSFADQRIPTLQQVLALAGDNAEVNVEIKSYRFHRIDPRHLVERVLAVVRGAGAVGRVLFTSFAEDVLAAVRQLEPQASVGYLNTWMRSLFRDPLTVSGRLGAQVFICARQEFRRSYLEDAHGGGMAVFVYTVNDPSEAQRLADAGVDGIITDAADKLLRIT